MAYPQYNLNSIGAPMVYSNLNSIGKPTEQSRWCMYIPCEPYKIGIPMPEI